VGAGFRAEPFQVHERDEGSARVIAVAGELDLRTAPDLCIRLDASRTRRAPRLLVDLTRLGFCDSTGMRALFGAAAEVRAHGGHFALACTPEGDVARLIEIVGAGEWMAVYPDAATALAALNG